MNTSDFVKAFAEQYNVAVQAADTWVRSIFAFLAEQCVENPEIKIAGFGVFKHNYIPARSYTDFKTGVIKKSEPRINLAFDVGPKLDREMRSVPVPSIPPKRGGRKSELPFRPKHNAEAEEPQDEAPGDAEA